MARRLICIVIAFALIFSATQISYPAKACGPFFPVTIFVQTKHPDLPLKRFANGELGVLRPSYARSYLVVAYKYLSGETFSASEQRQLLGLWSSRLNRKEELLAMHGGDAAAKWVKVRKEVTGIKNPDYVVRASGTISAYSTSGYSLTFFENCLDDAFATAKATLRARARQFGAHSRAVQSWVVAQDVVFENCDGTNSPEGDIAAPEAADPELPQIIRADREYQIGAAQFYAHHWEDAEKTFSRIAEDPNSPWKTVAAVVAVRCKIRKASMTDDVEALRNAEARLRQLRGDSGMQSVKPAIERLLGYLETRTSPELRVAGLARIIQKNLYPANLYRDLDDYTILLDRIIQDYPYSEQDYQEAGKIPGLFSKTRRLRQQNEMTDWILTYQADGDSAAAHALTQWKQKRTLPWLLCALAKAHTTSTEYQALLEESAKIGSESKAFLDLSYHRARLLLEAGQKDAARSLLDKTLESFRSDELPSIRNAYLGLRIKLASSLEEFAKFAARLPALVTSDEDGLQLPQELDWCKGGDDDNNMCKALRERSFQFDAETAVLLTERFPTKILNEFAQRPELPGNLRLQVAKAAFARAAILGDEKEGQKSSVILKELAPHFGKALDDYQNAAAGNERQFAALFLILRQPEMHPYISAGVGRETAAGKIDNYRDNWWCSWKKSSADSWRSINYYELWSGLSKEYGPAFVPDKTWPSFLSESDRRLSEREWEKISTAGSAVDFMSEPVLAWAKTHPEDQRVPETLHHLSRAYTYGCLDATKKNYSKIAFQLLHKKYPNSEWTKKTPYWY